LETAKAETRTAVVCVPAIPEVRVPNYEGWWDVPIAEVSGEASVREAREEYEVALKGQRVVW
jgi:3D-(3,5/4)-trihydroxycyclohexane-1,2-dione acylhydrolase (decyclizing)